MLAERNTREVCKYIRYPGSKQTDDAVEPAVLDEHHGAAEAIQRESYIEDYTCRYKSVLKREIIMLTEYRNNDAAGNAI